MLKVVQTIKTVRGARTMALDPVDAHDLPRGHRLRAAGARLEGSPEGGRRHVPRPDVSDEVSAAMIRSIARLLVAGLLARRAGGRAARRRARRPPDAPLTLQAALDQARANSQQFRAAQLASRPRRRGPEAGEGRAAAVGQRVQPVHLHAAQRHAVGRLGAERRAEHLRDVAQRARRRLLAREVGRVPQRRGGGRRRAREGRRRGARARRHDRAELLRAGGGAAQGRERAAGASSRRSSSSTSPSGTRAAARWRTPTS